jgi:hypothetical protein
MHFQNLSIISCQKNLIPGAYINLGYPLVKTVKCLTALSPEKINVYVLEYWAMDKFQEHSDPKRDESSSQTSELNFIWTIFIDLSKIILGLRKK